MIKSIRELLDLLAEDIRVVSGAYIEVGKAMLADELDHIKVRWLT